MYGLFEGDLAVEELVHVGLDGLEVLLQVVQSLAVVVKLFGHIGDVFLISYLGYLVFGTALDQVLDVGLDLFGVAGVLALFVAHVHLEVRFELIALFEEFSYLLDNGFLEDGEVI